MLDVHAPHERMHGFRDFLLHLLTITIGLLIALSLEGCVEWHHHRELVRQAEAALGTEIAQNAKTIGVLRQQIKDRQKELDTDLETLAALRAKPAVGHAALSFTFGMHTFDEVAWKTAQSTGSTAYMPYADASTYSDIYSGQDQMYAIEEQVVADVIRAASFPSTQSDSWRPTPAQIDELTDRIGTLQMRLLLLDSIASSLDKTYQKFESEHK